MSLSRKAQGNGSERGRLHSASFCLQTHHVGEGIVGRHVCVSYCAERRFSYLLCVRTLGLVSHLQGGQRLVQTDRFHSANSYEAGSGCPESRKGAQIPKGPIRFSGTRVQVVSLR